MVNVAKKIKEDMKSALLNKEKAKLSTLRLLVAKLENEKVKLKLREISELNNDQTYSVISNNIKEINKEIESYENVGRDTSKQIKEINLLTSYLPKQATEKEIRESAYHAVALVNRREIKNPMQYLSQRLKGKADMNLVVKIVKEVQKELNDKNTQK